MTRYATAALVTAIACLLAPGAGAQTARCAFGEPSMCSPDLPGLADQLPPELTAVRISSFAMRWQGGRWWVDLSLSTNSHPGTVTITAWRYDLAHRTVWLSGAQKSMSFPVGGADAAPYAVSVEWEANGATWHRWIGLHYDGPGTYHFTAGEGSLVPWWIE